MKNFIKYYFLLAFIIVCNYFYAQMDVVDSLKKELGKVKHDTTKCVLLINLGRALESNNDTNSFAFYIDGLNLAYKLKNPKLICRAHSYLASSYKTFGDYNRAIDSLNISKELCKRYDQKKLLASSCLELSYVYRATGEFEKAIKNGFDAVGLYEQLRLYDKAATGYNGLGNTYAKWGLEKRTKAEIERSLEYFDKALNVAKTDEYFKAKIYGNKGVAYYNLVGITNDTNNCTKARVLQLQALEIGLKLKDYNCILNAYNNLGALDHEMASRFYSLSNANAALNYFTKSLELLEELGIQEKVDFLINIASEYCLIGTIKKDNASIHKGIKKYLEALDIAKKSGNRVSEKDIHKNLMEAYIMVKDYPSSITSSRIYIALKDSIVQVESSKTIEEMATKYETGKKQKENELLKKQRELQDIQNKQQKTTIKLMIGGLVLLLAFVVLAIFAYRRIKKAKEEIELAKKTIEHQKEIVEEQQKEVLDSIRYAKKIQNALITNEKYIEKTLNKLQNN